jgi:NAD(P)-dependent dehydrogenase (short-subunit alcohol dehydrogenase family)
MILVTGATDGLGRALAERLARDGRSVILHGRDQSKLDRAVEEISTAHQVERPLTVRADLADLEEVRNLAAEVRKLTDRLEAFVSNAGIGSGLPDKRTRQTSKDGYELRFAVNYMAGFLLTQELLPLLTATVPARIVYVASLGQHRLDFDDLMLERGYSGTRAYGQSKLAQIMSGFELAQRLPAGEVTVNSLHPSTYMPTKMVLAEVGHQVDTLESGVEATYRLVADESLAGVTGKFFDRIREARVDQQAYDRAARAELWRRSLELVGYSA